MLDKLTFADMGWQFGAYGEWFDGAPPDRHLDKILDIKDWQLGPLGFWTLGTECPETMQEIVRRISRGIDAYMQFQDCLQVTFTSKEGLEQLEPYNRHYLYFESIVYLRESVVAWLNGNVLASCTLLRPFLELAVSHAYWHSKCEGRSYKPYYRWLDGEGGKPGFRNMLEETFRHVKTLGINQERVQQLHDTLYRLYQSLCSYNHTPLIEESLTLSSGGISQVSYDNLYYFAMLADVVLSQVLFLYVLTYPMVLFPVELYKKWGYGGPAGLLVDPRTSARVEAYLGRESTAELQRQVGQCEEVGELLQFYQGFPDLAPEELEGSWHEFLKEAHQKLENAPTTLESRLAFAKSHYRTATWAINYVPSRLKRDHKSMTVVTKAEADAIWGSTRSWA